MLAGNEGRETLAKYRAAGAGPSVPVIEVRTRWYDDAIARALGLDLADLAQDWSGPLEAAGFQRRYPTLWLVEGLLQYLEASAAAQVLNPGNALGRWPFPAAPPGVPGVPRGYLIEATKP